jgi:hypothetical protein
MRVVIFSTTFVWSNSHSKKNRTRCDQKRISVFMESTGCSCQILVKLEFFRHNFQKYSNIKFNENPSSGSWVVPCGQTDRRTDMMKLIVAFRSFANALKNSSFLRVTQLQIHTHTHTHTHTRTHILARVYILTYIHMHICMYAYTHTYVPKKVHR